MFDERISSTGKNTGCSDDNEDGISAELLRQLRQTTQMSENLKNPNFLPTITMEQLYDKTFVGGAPIVENILYPGCSLFVGPPKIGKSFFMLQLAYHVSEGMPLWGFPVQKGKVLYLALEDDESRLQERLFNMFGEKCSNNLFLASSVHKLGEGLEEQIEFFMKQYPDTILIIIDTLQKIRNCNGDRYSYSNDYDVISQMKKLADKYKICVLLVHHTRKQLADDKFDMISGTNGLLGAADEALVLLKSDRTSADATLDITGRDVKDQRFYLTRDSDHLSWKMDHVETETYKTSEDPILVSVNEFLSSGIRTWTGSATELLAELKTELSANALTRHLNVKASCLFHDYHIRYHSKHTRSGSQIRLMKEQTCDDNDDRDGINDTRT